jgi:hypothetical protein
MLKFEARFSLQFSNHSASESKFECFLHLKYNLLHNMVRPCGIIDRGRRGLDRMVVGFTTTYANENEINVVFLCCCNK